MEQLDKYIEDKMQEQKQELNGYIDSKVEEKMQNKMSRLNLEYETKESNVVYEATTDGLVFIDHNSSVVGYIDVMNSSGTSLYGSYDNTSCCRTLFVPKGCKWKAVVTDGTIRWFKFE